MFESILCISRCGLTESLLQLKLLETSSYSQLEIVRLLSDIGGVERGGMIARLNTRLNNRRTAIISEIGLTENGIKETEQLGILCQRLTSGDISDDTPIQIDHVPDGIVGLAMRGDYVEAMHEYNNDMLSVFRRKII